MRALVVGYGSIGMRHARILSELGCLTAVVSSREVDFAPSYRTLASALSAGHPDYVVLASATADHFSAVQNLSSSGYSGMLLVEKPLFAEVRGFPENSFSNVLVAYNMRFHPVVSRLRSLLEKETIISIHAYVGQYLPGWRPLTDYRKSYSACKEGGGVLRDLSHEIDYLTWILGGWSSVSALGGHVSPLEIESDDVYALLMTTPRCPVVSLQMNYLDRVARREIIVNTATKTIKADVISGTISVDGEDESVPFDRDSSYKRMHQALLSGALDECCGLKQAYEVMRFIEAAQCAAKNQQWVSR